MGGIELSCCSWRQLFAESNGWKYWRWTESNLNAKQLIHSNRDWAAVSLNDSNFSIFCFVFTQFDFHLIERRFWICELAARRWIKAVPYSQRLWCEVFLACCGNWNNINYETKYLLTSEKQPWFEVMLNFLSILRWLFQY